MYIYNVSFQTTAKEDDRRTGKKRIPDILSLYTPFIRSRKGTGGIVRFR